MILRKPYKFLIKNFKIIHLLLFLPILYLIIRTNRIFSFFNTYIANNYSYAQTGNLAGSYINLFMYISALIIVSISLVIFYLMKQKKKNTKLYMSFIIYYLILFIGLTIFYGLLSDIELEQLAAKTARAYRDISLILIVPQYFFAFYSVFRGLGFDIKSFKFELDLKDLDIDEKDNEEFEFVLGVETYKYKRTVRRFIREFKYYILENQFIFTCLSIILFLVIATTIFMHNFIYNRSYGLNKDFAHSMFTLNMKDTMLTNMDLNGKEITKDKYYLVIQLEITNNGIMKEKLDVNNFRLQIDGGSGYIVPTLDRTDYFTDFGQAYHGEEILKNTTTTYNLVYELNKNQLKKNYELKILENVEYKIGDLTAHYKILKIHPTRIDEKKEIKNYKLKETINLDDSNLGKSKTTIKGYEIKDNYLYSYELCNSFGCRTLNDVVSAGYTTSKEKTTLLILDVDTTLDENAIYTKGLKTINTFYEDYFTVSYDGKEITSKNVTPYNLKNKIVLQTIGEISTTDKLDLLITVRENIYKVNLKGE